MRSGAGFMFTGAFQIRKETRVEITPSLTSSLYLYRQVVLKSRTNVNTNLGDPAVTDTKSSENNRYTEPCDTLYINAAIATMADMDGGVIHKGVDLGSGLGQQRKGRLVVVLLVLLVPVLIVVAFNFNPPVRHVCACVCVVEAAPNAPSLAGEHRLPKKVTLSVSNDLAQSKARENANAFLW